MAKIDKTTRLLMKLEKQESQLAITAEKVNRALNTQAKTMGNVIVANVERANNSLSKTTLTMLNMRQAMRQIANESKNMFSGMNLSNLFAGYYLITRMVSALRSLTDVSDTAISTQARLGLYNQSKYTNEELYNFMYQSSQRSRTALTDTSDLVNRILVSGAMTGEGSATESIRIAEIINKASVAGGGTREEIQRSLRQLAQGLSSGALQGDELRSIREQTPFLAQMLAEGLNKVAPELGGNLAIGDLKQLGADGELTSERILKAFSAMEETINEKFNQMPRTFSQSMTQINNVWTKFIANLSKGGGALDKVNKTASAIADYLMSERGQAMLLKLGNIINGIADGLYNVGSFLAPIITFLLESTPIIETLIASLGVLLGMGIVSKIAGLVTSMGAMGKVGLGVAGVMMAMAVASGVASLAFQAMGDSSTEANKKVQAGWASMGQNILGVIEWLINGLLHLIMGIPGVILSFLEVIGNLVGAIGATIIAGVAKIVAGIASIIDKFLGTNYAEGINNFADGLVESAWTQFGNTWGEGSVSDQYHDLQEALFGKGFSAWIGDTSAGGMNYWQQAGADAYMASIENQDKLEAMFKEAQDFIDKAEAGDVKFNVGNVDSVGGTVDISSEDLKLLKDIASRDLLLSMTSVTPQANVTFGDVRETADVNKIMDVIEDMVENAFATSLVYND